MRRATRLRQTLEQEILTGELAPLTRLDEAGLAARFSVSRTPVREALVELAATGLVDIRPHHGAVVAQVTLKRLFEMFETMAELEAVCCRLAVRRITPQELADLTEIHAECRRLADDESDTDAYYEINARFHEAIYRATHNEFLTAQVTAIRNRLAPYRRMQLLRLGRVRESFAEHDAIMNAIRGGDPERAHATMREHVSVQGERFNDLLSSLPNHMVATPA